jgi:hypothetical protein
MSEGPMQGFVIDFKADAKQFDSVIKSMNKQLDNIKKQEAEATENIKKLGIAYAELATKKTDPKSEASLKEQIKLEQAKLKAIQEENAALLIMKARNEGALTMVKAIQPIWAAINKEQIASNEKIKSQLKEINILRRDVGKADMNIERYLKVIENLKGLIGILNVKPATATNAITGQAKGGVTPAASGVAPAGMEKELTAMQRLKAAIMETRVEFLNLKEVQNAESIEFLNMRKAVSEYHEQLVGLKAGFKGTEQEQIAFDKQVNSAYSSLNGLDKIIEHVSKVGLYELRDAFQGGQISAQQWRDRLLMMETGLKDTAPLFQLLQKEVEKADKQIADAAPSMQKLNASIREIMQVRNFTGLDVAVQRLRALDGAALQVVGGAERLGAAIKEVDVRIRGNETDVLKTQLATLRNDFDLTKRSAQNYAAMLNELKAATIQAGLGDNAINLVDRAIIKLNKDTAKAVPSVNEFKVAMASLNTGVTTGKLSLDQYIVELKKLRPSVKDDAIALNQLETQIMKATKQMGNMAHTTSFLGQTAKTAFHHFQWMLSGSLIMPIYNLPSQIMETVTKLDASFAKLKSQFETKPEFAGNLDMIDQKMREMTEWSFRFSRYYGDSIENVNEVIYQASKVYSKTADIIVASNAGIKLSIMDMTGADTIESMKKFVAVTQQFGIAPKDMDYFINQIIEAGHLVRATSGEIMDALARNASVFKTVNADVTTAVTITALSLQKIGTSAETAGVSWKTLLQRMADPKLGKLMKEIGIDMYNGKEAANDFGGVMEQLMAKFAQMSDKERMYFTKQVAGIRQGNVLIGVLKSTAEEYDHLKSTISGTPELLASRVMPSIATQLETLQRRITSTSQVWHAFVYQLAQTGQFKRLLFDFLDKIIRSLDWLSKHKADVILFGKGLIFLAGAIALVNTNMKIMNTLTALGAFGLGREAAAMGALTLTMEGGAVATGEFTLAAEGAAVGLGTLTAAFVPLLVVAAAYLAVTKALDYYAKKPLRSAQEFADSTKASRERVNSMMNEKVLNDKLIAQQDALETKKKRKDQRFYTDPLTGAKKKDAGLTVDELQKNIDQTKGQIDRLKQLRDQGFTSLLDVKPAKSVNDLLGFDLEGDFNAMLSRMQAESTAFAKAQDMDRKLGLDTSGDKKKKKGNVYTFEEQYKDKLQLIMDYLEKLERANSKTMAQFERNTDDARKSLVGFFGEMVNNKDVKAYHDTINSLYIRYQNMVRKEKVLVDDYSGALKALKKNKEEVDAKKLATDIGKEERGKLEQSSRDYQKAIDDVLDKQEKAQEEIFKMNEAVKDVIKQSAEATVSGLNDTYKKLTEGNDKLLEDGKITPHQWQHNWHKATQELVKDFEPLQKIMKEGYAANPRSYIAEQGELIKQLTKADLTKAENAAALEDAVMKKATAEMFFENVTLKQISHEKSLADDIYPRQYELLKRKHELQKAQINLSGRETLTIAEQEIQAKESLALLGKRMLLAISLNDKEEAHTLLMEAFGIKQAIYDAKKAEAAAVLNYQYDRQLKSLEEQYRWKSLMVRDDQQGDLALINNLEKKEILLNKQADLYAKLNFSLTDNQRIVDDEWQAYVALGDEIESLNTELAAQVPLFKEIMAAQNTAFSSMKDNIKTTFTDLFDSSKSFMQAFKDMFARQGEIVKNTIINALTDALAMKLGSAGGMMDSFAKSQGDLTAGIFKIFGITAPQQEAKAEKIWNSVWDESAKALRVTFPNQGRSATSTGNPVADYALDMLSGTLGISLGSKSTGGKIGGAASGASKTSGGVHGGKTAAALSIISQLVASGDSSGGWASSLGGMLGQMAGEATGGVFGSIFSGLGAMGGPVGAMIGTILGTVGSNALGVGRGQTRRDTMATQQEQRASTIADIKSRYESLGMAVSDSQLAIPDYIERSERSKGGLSGTSRWYEDNGVTAALDAAQRKIGQIEDSIKLYETAVKDMNNALAMGATRFNVAGQAIGQTIGGWQTKTDALRPGGTYREWTIGSAESIFGPGGILEQNILGASQSFNSLTSQIDLLKYQLNQMALAGAEESDAFKEAAQNLLELTQKQYWNGIMGGIVKSDFLQQFGIKTDVDKAAEYAKAIRAAFGLGDNQTIDQAEIQKLAQQIADSYVLMQQGSLSELDATNVQTKADLLTEMQTLINTLSTSQLGQAAVGSSSSLGESISGSSSITQNTNNYTFNAEYLFSTDAEFQTVVKRFFQEAKKQGYIVPSAVNL